MKNIINKLKTNKVHSKNKYFSLFFLNNLRLKSCNNTSKFQNTNSSITTTTTNQNILPFTSPMRKQIKPNKLFPSPRYFSTKLSSRKNINPNNKRIIRFTNDFDEGSKLIIPISMGRYNISKEKTEEYDQFLNALLTETASLLELNYISQVDVLSTADLQRINWKDELTDQVEEHFFNTHKDILVKQSHSYKWHEWVKQNDINEFNKNYQFIVKASRPNTQWHNLMVKTHKTVKMSNDLENSIEYQRQEYAAIMLMKNYTNLIYTGPLSLAWSYMYHILPNGTLPSFTRAIFAKLNKNQSIINVTNTSYGTKLLLSNIEQMLVSPNVPKAERQQFIDYVSNLLFYYGNKQTKEGMNNHIDPASIFRL